jgi:hypothetical protein
VVYKDRALTQDTAVSGEKDLLALRESILDGGSARPGFDDHESCAPNVGLRIDLGGGGGGDSVRGITARELATTLHLEH